jgi:cysteinyl-tRNA synthetase
MVRIHDSLAKRAVELTTRVPGRVSMYVCGPTVYDVPHVGHGRTAVVYDVIRRYLEWRGNEVSFVGNVTNVEDKIIARAASEGTSERELADRYEQAYWNELARLNVRRPDDVPRATEFIEPMVELIRELVDSGHAYVIEGEGVYFSVASYERYGELSGRKLDDLLEGAGARVEVDEQKRSPVDFALWKAAKPGEPDWESPWGRGRPGWHIECSAMSLSILGEGFDLHGGGDDLVFPHHENERAQADAAGHEFATHWIHSGMVMVGAEKMSKSLGNFTTLGDALDDFGADAFRLAVLQVHYRSRMELTAAELGAAAEGIRRVENLRRRAAREGVSPSDPDPAVIAAFTAAMDDDFGTPAAVAAIFDAVRAANAALDGGEPAIAAARLAAVEELLDALGFARRGSEASDDHDEIEGLVRDRDAARAARDFATADRIRDELAARGVTIEDRASGTTWHR